MRAERATKFGLVAATGIVLISLATYGLIQQARSPLRGDTVVLLVLIGGTVTNLIFLFMVIGVYVERKLEARGLITRNEEVVQ